MLLIAENINIMSKTFGPAIREREKAPLQKAAEAIMERGLDVIDLNIGPARKDGPEMMAWLVETVQEVGPCRLSLDTTNPDAMRAGLQVADARAIINSTSAVEERMNIFMPMALEHGADLVSLTMTEDGVPRDASERTEAAMQIVMAAAAHGLDNGSLLVDGIVTPVTIDHQGPASYLEYLPYLEQLAVPPVNSVCGLSNVSNGAPDELRGILNRTFLIMAMRLGQGAAIVDAFDDELMELARGGLPDAVQAVYAVMDGNDFAPDGERAGDYAKTARVFTGETLYCHSWLEL